MTIKRLTILILLLTLSSSLYAQRFNTKQIRDAARDGQWESSITVQYQNGNDFGGDGGSSIDIDDTWGWGFTVGYNLTAKWNLNFRFGMTKPDYLATIVPEDPEEEPTNVGYRMTKYTSHFNATYNFLEGPITPFIQAGAGWTRLDSNIPDGPPSGTCWWDPWWGWVCWDTWTTYDTTRFSYNAGLGVRWDINPALFSRATYNREWVDARSGTLDFDMLTLEIGLMW